MKEEAFMKGLSTNPKVLLCTSYRRYKNDYFSVSGIVSAFKFPRARSFCRISPGLRFIKQNVPQVEILEHPLWYEYVEKLKEGWDVVGFSFYQKQIGEIIRMIEEARRHGIKEIWAGNYGALDYSIPSLVDRVFIGSAEDKIARVFGRCVPDNEVEHPAMMVHFSLFPALRHLTFGMIYTAHGCPFECTFCQNTAFVKRHFTINFTSIKRVLEYYHKLGISEIVVLDELFGIYPKFADKITNLLARYKFRWWALSRASIFLANLDTWYERGLRLPSIGVESLKQDALDIVRKKQKVWQVLEFARRTREKPGMYRIAAFMVGYENMTAEETIEDAIQLKKVGFDAHTANIITPFPQTQLWDELDSKYGIFDRTYRHYDVKHLVWKHPLISSTQMHYLAKSVRAFLNRPFDVYRSGLKRLFWEELRAQGPRFLWQNLVKGPINTLSIDDRKQFFFPKLPHRTPLQSQRRRRQVTTRQGKSVHAERS
ncbi:MAG: radical SAM protein [Candidatus Stahlbacteria bacterium]|nr:MAG: radical SAM protein [Candidatus Stahlbacteria bacterium]